MIIAAKKVRAAQRYRCGGWNCDLNDCPGWIEAGEVYVRLFGMADYPDPPYVLRINRSCVNESPELERALVRAGQSL